MSTAILQLVDELETEHRDVRASLSALAALAEASDDAGLLTALSNCAAVLGIGLDEHTEREDGTLFPFVAEAIGHGVVDVFVGEHVRILALRDRLYESHESGDVLELQSLLESHIEREEAVLFPSVRDLLGGT
ncbi:MAG: hemerythrin domain-containing protein [Acidimicrobiales bacterium]